jgi:hypothetical protein
MKVRVAQSGITRLLGRIGVIGALAMVLMASRCSGDDETGSLETTGDVPEETSPADAPAAAAQEPTDPLGDPFVAPADGDGAQDPAANSGAPEGDDSSMLEDPSYEPESAPETSDL